MAAIRCAGRTLLRRTPGLLRRAADVGERGQHPMGAMALSSKSYVTSVETSMNKKLAAALMKERPVDKEIENMDEMLRLINSTKDNNPFKYVSPQAQAVSDSSRQHAATRSMIEKKKDDLVSSLLRPNGGEEYKIKMEEFAATVRSHRASLLLEALKGKCELLEEQNAKIMAGMVAGVAFWGLPLTFIVLSKLQ